MIESQSLATVAAVCDRSVFNSYKAESGGEPPHSRRFARLYDDRHARQRLECGVFSTAFPRFALRFGASVANPVNESSLPLDFTLIKSIPPKPFQSQSSLIKAFLKKIFYLSSEALTKEDALNQQSTTLRNPTLSNLLQASPTL